VIHPRALLPSFLAALLLVPSALLQAQAAVEVQVTPAQLRLKVGQQERLFLSAYDSDGNLLGEPAFSFTVSQDGVVRVDKDGTVAGLAAGSVRIEVRSGTGKVTVPVTVTGAPAPVPPAEPEPVPVLPAGARLVPSPESLKMLRLETARPTMRLLTPDGTGLGQVHVTWRSTAPVVAAVNDIGEVTALQLGEAQLVATGPGGLTASINVEVREDSLAVAPDRLMLPVAGADSVRVFVPGQGGRSLSTGLVWRSSDSTIVRVSRTGVARGVAPGEAYMLVMGYGQQRAVRVTVHPPIARLRLAPSPGAPLRLTPGAAVSFVLEALAADSLPIADAGYRWQVGDTTVAAFDPAARRLTALGIGRTTLTMSTYGFEPTVWEVEVVAGGLAFQRPRFRLAPRERDSLIVSLVDAEGRTVGPPSGVEFSVNRTEVATVDAAGVVTAVAVGSAVVTARTPWGTAASARLFVTEDLLISVKRGAGTDLIQLDPADAGSLVPLVADGQANTQAVWSPDGTRIAFAATVGGNTDVYVADADGKNAARITEALEADQEPTWSPDGGTIAFTSLRTGSPQIWAMNADGTGVRQLTTGTGANSAPAFRPDGQIIAFISTRDGTADLFEMGNEGADPRAITRTPETEAFPAYFPDGDLAVTVERPGRGDILRIRAGDGQRIMLQSMAGRVTSLAISGDGSTLAFGLSEPAVVKNVPPVQSFRLKSLSPDHPPVVLNIVGEVLSASFQGTR